MERNVTRSNEATGSLKATEAPDKANVVGWVDALSEGADEELIHALWHIADSAWGRGLAAHHLANSGSEIPERMLLTLAEGVLRRAAQDGDIEVRGRQPSKLDYETIPREHWRLIFVDLEPDDRTMYRTVIKPRADVSPERVASLLEFDSLIVSRKRLSKLWPTIPPAAPLLNSTVPDAGEADAIRLARRGRISKDWGSVENKVRYLMSHHGEFDEADPDWNCRARLEAALLAEFEVGVTQLRKHLPAMLDRWRAMKVGK